MKRLQTGLLLFLLLPSSSSIHREPADAAAPTDLRPEDAGRAMVEGIACGEQVCAVPTQVCRVTCIDDSGERRPTCMEPTGGQQCPVGEDFPVLIARCDGAEDCSPGQVCSVLHGSAGTYVQCACEAGDERCPAPWETVLCHSDADCPASTPRCRPGSDVGDFFLTCQE